MLLCPVFAEQAVQSAWHMLCQSQSLEAWQALPLWVVAWSVLMHCVPRRLLSCAECATFKASCCGTASSSAAAWQAADLPCLQIVMQQQLASGAAAAGSCVCCMNSGKAYWWAKPGRLLPSISMLLFMPCQCFGRQAWHMPCAVATISQPCCATAVPNSWAAQLQDVLAFCVQRCNMA